MRVLHSDIGMKVLTMVVNGLGEIIRFTEMHAVMNIKECTHIK